jgi:hypothetical protein
LVVVPGPPLNEELPGGIVCVVLMVHVPAGTTLSQVSWAKTFSVKNRMQRHNREGVFMVKSKGGCERRMSTTIAGGLIMIAKSDEFFSDAALFFHFLGIFTLRKYIINDAVNPCPCSFPNPWDLN